MYKKLQEGKFFPRVPVNMLRSHGTRDQYRALSRDMIGLELARGKLCSEKKSQ